MIDNNISLTGQATDTIRVRLKFTDQLDVESRIIDSVDVIPVIFPPLVDVPYRRVNDENHNRMNEDAEADEEQLTIEVPPQIVDLFPIEIYTTQAHKIYIGDLIFRVIIEPHLEYPMVLVLEVVDALGTFGTHSMIYGKFNTVYYNDKLPQEVTDYVAATARRRLQLNW